MMIGTFWSQCQAYYHYAMQTPEIPVFFYSAALKNQADKRYDNRINNLLWVTGIKEISKNHRSSIAALTEQIWSVYLIFFFSVQSGVEICTESENQVQLFDSFLFCFCLLLKSNIKLKFVSIHVSSKSHHNS